MVVLGGCGKKPEIYAPKDPMTFERITVTFSDEDKPDYAGTMRIPLPQGVITNCPPTTYFEDATGQIWDAKWERR